MSSPSEDKGNKGLRHIVEPSAAGDARVGARPAASHTPGPWTHFHAARRSIIEHRDDYRANSGQIIGETYGPDRFANARLFAVAPKLLAACKALAGAVAPADVAMAVLGESAAAWSNIAEALVLTRDAIAEANGPLSDGASTRQASDADDATRSNPERRDRP